MEDLKNVNQTVTNLESVAPEEERQGVEAKPSATETPAALIWMGPRINGVQEKIDLRDCGKEDLKKYLEHCEKMLYNTDDRNPGRLTLVDITNDQIQRCRAELLVRWLRSERNYTYQNCYEDIRALIRKNAEMLTADVVEQYPINNLISGIPDEYKRVTVGLVLKACMYSLGVFDTSHITLNFLVKLGLYLTKQEMQELIDRGEDGKIRNRFDVIKEREGLKAEVRLTYSSTGLTYNEFHQMRKLRKDKYENYTTQQLAILSTKVLYQFQLRCEKQAGVWKDKMEQIKKLLDDKR